MVGNRERVGLGFANVITGANVITRGNRERVGVTHTCSQVAYISAASLEGHAVAAATKSKVKNTHKPFLVGNVQTESGQNVQTRMAILLWGAATCGKTTLAATAPGHKLWLSFGDNEHTSVMHRDDVTIANLSYLTLEDLFKHAQSDNPFGLDQILREQEHIETVVCDSATALTFRALQKSVKDGVGAGKNFRPTMEVPGRAAYGGRNAIVLECLTGLLKVTAKYKVHVIITAHEDDPTMRQEDGKEVIDYVAIQLGGKLVNNMTWRLSEIWFMSQETTVGQRRRLAIRPTRLRRPMKTRMFVNNGPAEFFLEYDADKPDDAKGQMTIAKFYDEWVDNGYKKIAVPNNMVRSK